MALKFVAFRAPVVRTCETEFTDTVPLNEASVRIRSVATVTTARAAVAMARMVVLRMTRLPEGLETSLLPTIERLGGGATGGCDGGHRIAFFPRRSLKIGPLGPFQ